MAAANHSTKISSIFLLSLFFLCSPAKSQSPTAPAIYVFGDSQSDSGNNNFLPTVAKVDFRPYGVDFPSQLPTGRFSNGKTLVDFIAELLGLPLAPAYLSLSASERSKIATGINYASGAGGILPETGTATGDILSLDEQIAYFERTVTIYLLNIFRTPTALFNHLANSIIFVSIGNNDYINNYLQPANYSSSSIYTPQQFADRLLNKLRIRLTRLYILGGRKFVVFNIGRLGCTPATVDTANPRPITPCVEDVNNLVMLYNAKFPSMITKLESTLVGSTFVRGDSFNVNRNSSEAGISTAQTPCCEVSGVTGLCLEDSTPCSDRSKFIFWDAFHTTELVNQGMASECFSSNSSCVPINIQQLAQKQ